MLVLVLLFLKYAVNMKLNIFPYIIVLLDSICISRTKIGSSEKIFSNNINVLEIEHKFKKNLVVPNGRY